MLSTHWLYRRSRNSVVKTFGADFIAISRTASTFNMADVNVSEGDSLMASSSLKSNAGDQKVCKKTKLTPLFDADKKNPFLGITVWHHSAKPPDAKQ